MKPGTKLWVVAVVVAVAAAGVAATEWQAMGIVSDVDRTNAEHGNATYSIAEAEMPKLQAAARAGDCEAAFKIGQYHTFVTLDTEEAIVWMRLASPCESVPAKQTIVTFLLERKDQASVANEIDQLLDDLDHLDEEAAKSTRDYVAGQRARRQKTAIEKNEPLGQ